MKTAPRIFSRRGFLASSVLGGLIAPFLRTSTAEAAPSTMWPNVRYRTLAIPKNVSQAQPVGNWVKISDIGTVEIQSWNSIIELTYQGRVKATGGGKTTFALTLFKDVNYGYTAFEVLPEQLMQNVFAYFTHLYSVEGYYSPGIYTVSLWGYTDTPPGGAVFMNPTSSSEEFVLFKEYLPIGTTYLPTIMK